MTEISKGGLEKSRVYKDNLGNYKEEELDMTERERDLNEIKNKRKYYIFKK